MTNQEAINTTKEFIADLEACDIPIYADEREALEKLISTAEVFMRHAEKNGYGTYV